MNTIGINATPAEIADIFWETPMSEVEFAFNACKENDADTLNKSLWIFGDKIWEMIAVAYAAGKVNGMRSERKRNSK